MAQTDPDRILLVGCNFASLLCMARSFGLAGYQVDIFRVYGGKLKLRHHMKFCLPDKASKYVSNFYPCVLEGDEERLAQGLLELGRTFDKKRLIIITDDLSTSAIDKHYAELSDYFVVSNIRGETGAVVRAMNRDEQKRLAAEVGLPVLNSCELAVDSVDSDALLEVRYPCIVKANNSAYVDKTLLKKCADEAQLKAVLEEYRHRDVKKVLVEDFIEVAHEYSLIGAASVKGAVCPGGLEATLGGTGRQLGIAVKGEVLPRARMAEFADAAVSLVEKLHYEGLFDVDFIEDAAGNVYFTELNLRLGASGFAIVKSGVNLPAMYADYMLKGTPIDTAAEVVAPTRSFVNEKILCTEYANGGVTKHQLEEILSEDAVFFIRDDEDDPVPYERFKSIYSYASLLRKLPFGV